MQSIWAQYKDSLLWDDINDEPRIMLTDVTKMMNMEGYNHRSSIAGMTAEIKKIKQLIYEQ